MQKNSVDDLSTCCSCITSLLDVEPNWCIVTRSYLGVSRRFPVVFTRTASVSVRDFGGFWPRAMMRDLIRVEFVLHFVEKMNFQVQPRKKKDERCISLDLLHMV